MGRRGWMKMCPPLRFHSSHSGKHSVDLDHLLLSPWLVLRWEAQMGDQDARSSALGAWVPVEKINYIAFWGERLPCDL